MMHTDRQFLDLSHEALPASQTSVGGSVVFWAAKRTAEVFLCLALLPIVVFFAAILVLLNPMFNRGKLFYSQTRYGRDMHPFRMWKFRTMVGDTDDSKFATEEQNRITKFGEFIRSKHIDELPQIWNVLKGDMSIIGPRPEQKRFVMEYLEHIPDYSDRHLVRPGVTGLAQVKQGYTDSLDATRDKLTYDLQYIRSSGFAMEVQIILHTVALIISRFLKRS
jgi:lipopolysaccharide/colanic/teichoic acid biosynthesis glycosyltransferase